ncbi:MAG TPA: ring-cleaving dioxygenase, partial [Chloroflexota bacterium]|nr:ring-cleaving dioxygenase [Chloroflexota bacterium]
AFYTQVLGLRLVKKTVNQDDVSAYHLFYGDEKGSPGTEVTFFDWPNIGPYAAGVGEVSTIKLRVPGRDALDWWSRRFDELGIAHQEQDAGTGRRAISFLDHEGQRLQLMDDGGAPGGTPWSGSPVPTDRAIRGMYAISLVVDNLGPTAHVLTDVLGFRRGDDFTSADNEARRVTVFEVGPGGPGAEVHVEERPELPRARVGIGGVHHIAFRTPNDEEHREWRARIAAAQISVTPPIDRYYFRSIYFREPGGVLFEIATDGPGFATDEDAAHLGERLALPPFLEPHRNEIEAGLRPIEPLRLATEK